MKNKLLFLILFILATLSGVYFNAIRKENQKNLVYLKQIQKQEIADQNIKNTFDKLNIKAKSALVVDTSNKKVLYSNNSDHILPLASITKVMTAIVATELIDKNKKIQISNESLDEEGNNGLLSGEKWDRDDLIKFSLIASSNDGARALAMEGEKILNPKYDGEKFTPLFVERMNQKAKDLNMPNTIFYNPTGLDISKTKPGAVGSTKDVITMMHYAITKYPEIYKDTTLSKTNFKSNKENHIATNTNHAILELSDLVASKTGMTNLAGGNLAIAFEPITGHTIIAVVLGSSYEGRFLDIEQLAKSSKDVVDSL